VRTLEQVGPALPGVARDAVSAWVAERRQLDVSQPDAPAAPVFVTLRNPDGSLRGCIGTLRATELDVVTETARNAVLAATGDPRFSPVSPDELARLSIEVSVLLPDEPAAGLQDLDPARYGVVVSDRHGRDGVLLPGVPGVRSAAEQVDIARRKAGIGPGEAVILRRFEVLKFGG
jgi:AmmeMemoRadiSam system protein A